LILLCSQGCTTTTQGNQDDVRMEDIKAVESPGSDLQEHVKNALLILNEASAPKNDPMSIVRKEAEYYEDLIVDGSHVAAKPFDGKKQDASNYYEEARKELKSAWSFVEKLQQHSIEKVNILSAVGETYFRGGDYESAQNYYDRALRSMEKLAARDNTRVADLYPIVEFSVGSYGA
ncbi:hypothetical protein Tsubulata_007443, partial [Turnera subulata]